MPPASAAPAHVHQAVMPKQYLGIGGRFATLGAVACDAHVFACYRIACGGHSLGPFC